MSSKRKRTSASTASTKPEATIKQARTAQSDTATKTGSNTHRRREDEDNDDESTTSVTATTATKASSKNGKQDKKDKDTHKDKDNNKDDDDSTASSNVSKSPTPVYSYSINPPPVGRPVRIYCDGIYDLFHFGHAKALEQAKKAFPDVYLLVGVCDDAMTHNRKGKTVMTDKERYESVRHCKWVDEVVEAAPWVVDQAFLDKHKIDYVAHDDIPYKSVEGDDVYAFVKNSGNFLPTNRTDGVSTSDLITRIVKDYDQYLRRNLERGVTAKELGIGFFKEQEVKLKKSAQDIRASIRQNWHGTKDELKNEISVLRNDLRQTMSIWEDKSQEFVRDFSKLFGADSVVNKIFRRRRHHGNLITDGASPSASGPSSPSSSRMASPDSREGSDSEDFSRSRSFFRGSSSNRAERSRSESSVADSFGDQSPRSDSD
ncbi:hypothetical protein BGZ52_012882 [Haplosporangium bisporale]|nr:hypothetical protein BGZ52_012882 [Haplosporangium bisporale]KAF9215598.1 hypothetical protein BGZ59_000873 [Podila verticillata]KFH68596.1 choline-phosphate cytidylyltransferase [Podila verticillata NRRL 6337]